MRAEIALELAGSSKVRYLVKDKVLGSCGSRAASRRRTAKMPMRVLLDRTSVEVFGNHGLVSVRKNACCLTTASRR